MNRIERNRWRDALGLTGSYPGARRKARRNRRRDDDRPMLGRWFAGGRRWWNRTRRRWNAWLGGSRRRKNGQKTATQGVERGPVVETFLGGASARECAYRHWHRGTSPELVTAKDWPDAVAQSESAVRRYCLELEEELARLREA